MTFQKGVQNFDSEAAFTEDEISVIWEQFFGKRWSLGHIAKHFNVDKVRIVRAIEHESERYQRGVRKAHSSPKLKHQPLLIPTSHKINKHEVA